MQVKNIRVELCGILPNLFELEEKIQPNPCFCVLQTFGDKSKICIHPPNSPPCFSDDNREGRALLMNMEINHALKAENAFDFPKALPEKSEKQIALLLDDLFVAHNPFDEMSISYKIAKEMVSSATAKSNIANVSVRNALEYIRNNYTQRITISDLAGLLRMSESNVYSSFKKQYGMSPIAYLNEYRLFVASELLSTTSYSIENVATAVGMTDMRYFSKMFKRRYNTTPSTYRKNSSNEVKK